MNKIKMLLFTFIGVLALPAIFFAQSNPIQQVSPETAKLLADNHALMIDVREKDEVDTLAYDVKNIINIPLSELESRINEIPQDKELIIACRTGNRSSQAIEILQNGNFERLYNLEGGIVGWQEASLDVTKNNVAPVKACCSGEMKKDGSGKEGMKGQGAEKACCAQGEKGNAATGKACCAQGGKGKANN